MKHCFYHLTAAANRRIFHYMGATHRHQQGFQALAHIVRMCCAAGRSFFNSQSVYVVSLYGSMGKLPVFPHLTQLGRKAYVCYLKPLGVFTR